MALFSDGPPSTIDNLVQYDSYLVAVATTEGIDVTTKLQLAYNELGIELTAIFAREASIYAPVLGEAPLDTNHLAVTPALLTWHTYKTLELVYRDAYYNQLNNRYQGKWIEYQGLALWSQRKFVDLGAGLVIDPLPQPAAPVVTFQAASQSGGMCYVSLTFVNAEGQESTPALVSQAMVPDGNIALIGAPVWPSNAVGWNMYAGASPTSLTLQNTPSLTLGTNWQLILPVASTGAPIGAGQVPDVTRDIPRRIMRG